MYDGRAGLRVLCDFGSIVESDEIDVTRGLILLLRSHGRRHVMITMV